MENNATNIGNIDFLEQVSHACGGALLVSEARAAKLVNVSVKTLRNQRRTLSQSLFYLHDGRKRGVYVIAARPNVPYL